MESIYRGALDGLGGFLLLRRCSDEVFKFADFCVQFTDNMKNKLVVFIFEPFFGEIVGDGNEKLPVSFREDTGIFEPGGKVCGRYLELKLCKYGLPKLLVTHRVLL